MLNNDMMDFSQNQTTARISFLEHISKTYVIHVRSISIKSGAQEICAFFSRSFILSGLLCRSTHDWDFPHAHSFECASPPYRLNMC